MSRRALPHYERGSPITAAGLNETNQEIGRLGALASRGEVGVNEFLFNSTAGVFRLTARASSTSTGGTVIFRFRIDEMVDTIDGFRAANVTVCSVPPGVSLVTEDIGTGSGTQVTVLDTLGCLFDEDDADLVGRYGYAAQLETVAHGTGSGTGTAESDEGATINEAISLCCPL